MVYVYYIDRNAFHCNVSSYNSIFFSSSSSYRWVLSAMYWRVTFLRESKKPICDIMHELFTQVLSKKDLSKVLLTYFIFSLYLYSTPYFFILGVHSGR